MQAAVMNRAWTIEVRDDGSEVKSQVLRVGGSAQEEIDMYNGGYDHARI